MGIAGVSDDGAAVASARVARGLLAYLAPLDLPLIEHAEDPALSSGSVMRAGETARGSGSPAGRPARSCRSLSVTSRLAAETGGWVHFTHLSTAGGLDAIRRAKERGIRVTCDVTPHHLALTDAWVAGWRGFAWEDLTTSPPIRSALRSMRPSPTTLPAGQSPAPPRGDALALLGGVADGTIDAIATDHAPHPRERKAVEFGAAAPGMIGLETALSSGWRPSRQGS